MQRALEVVRTDYGLIVDASQDVSHEAEAHLISTFDVVDRSNRVDLYDEAMRVCLEMLVEML